jgi:predicted N-acyltransferase
MEMDVEEAWQTVKDYEKALKHKYAQRFRKIRSGWEKLQIKELSVNDVRQEKETIFQLYNNISQKQTVRLGILNADYLPLLKEQFPDTLKVWMVYEEETPVAFFSAWLHEAAFDMFYIGMDYARNEELQLYFNILFFSVEQAIAFRKEKLILGRTALEAKARLGCRPHYLHTYLFIPNGLLRAFVRSIQQNVNEGEGAWENRHPFKPLPQAKTP